MYMEIMLGWVAIISIYVGNKSKSVLLTDSTFASDVIEICNAKSTIASESIFVIGIYRPPNKA